METEFNYYVLEPIITARTAFLVNDPNVDSKADRFLRQDRVVENPSTLYVCEAFGVKKPDFSVDFLNLDGFAVFSQKVCDIIIKNNISINDLQLIKVVITEDNEEYDNFTLAYVHRKLKTFDEELSEARVKNIDGRWIDVKKIILDRKILSKIPLKDRLTYRCAEFTPMKLYHESIVDIIKSANPTGVKFIPIEEWVQ